MIGDYPKRRSGVSIRAVEGELVVLDLEAEQVHQLNPTASFIWQRCDGQRTVGKIADELAGSFDVDPDTAREAVIGALRRLDELGLLDQARD
jgi:hypothetical protein